MTDLKTEIMCTGRSGMRKRSTLVLELYSIKLHSLDSETPMRVEVNEGIKGFNEIYP